MNDWEQIHQSRHWGTYPDPYMVRQVKAFLSSYKKNTGTLHALDIGCGAGAHTWMMNKEGMSVWALDISSTALSQLKDIPCVKCLGDVNAYVNFEPGMFDFILDNVSLTHVEKPNWDRILSWLRPGGWLVSASFDFWPEPGLKAWFHPVGEAVERHQRVTQTAFYSIVLHRYVKPEGV